MILCFAAPAARKAPIPSIYTIVLYHGRSAFPTAMPTRKRLGDGYADCGKAWRAARESKNHPPTFFVEAFPAGGSGWRLLGLLVGRLALSLFPRGRRRVASAELAPQLSRSIQMLLNE
jgi:hypothetical protein